MIISEDLANEVGLPTYEWKKNDATPVGENAETYVIPNNAETGDTFTVTVTDGNRSTSSEPTQPVVATPEVTLGTVEYKFENNEFIGVDVPFTLGGFVGAVEATVTDDSGYTATISNNTVEVRKSGNPVPGTELTVTVTNYNVISDPVTFTVVEEKFARPTGSNTVEYTVQKVNEDGTAQLTTGSDQKWYYVANVVGTGVNETASVLTALRAIYEPNKPTAIKTTNSSIAYPNTEWTEAISANVLGLFKYSVAAEANGDLIYVEGTNVPTTTTEGNLIVIDIGIPEVDNSAVPVFTLGRQSTNFGATGQTQTRVAVNKGAYLTFGTGNGAETYSYFSGNLLIRYGGYSRELGTSGWGLGANSSLSIMWGGNFAVFPGNRDGTAATNGYQGLTGWLIGKDDGARIQWDGTDSQTGGAYIDIIPDNLRSCLESFQRNEDKI